MTGNCVLLTRTTNNKSQNRNKRHMLAQNLNLNFLNIQASHDKIVAQESLEEDAGFTLPPKIKPGNFLQEAFGCPGAPEAIQFAHGTTTLAFLFKGGAIVAVDSRSTMGPYIASQTVKKVIEINPYLLGTMAGGAADCSFWERELGRRCRLLELRNKERISVAGASKLLANIVYSYKGYGLSMGTMITGWDKTGAHLYYVDSDGTRLQGQRFCVGSGGTYAYGVLDSGYSWDLEVDAAIELGRRSIYHATHRDAYSGGIINVYHVHEKGWTKISADDCTKLHYEKYYPDEGTK